jgi:hypothetical protein
MVHQYVRDNDHGLTIIQVNPYGQKFMIMLRWALNPMVILWLVHHACLNESHGYGFASSVGHLMPTASIWWYAYNIRDVGVVLKILRDRDNSAGKGLISCVEHMKLNYNMIFFTYVLYLYCIHDHREIKNYSHTLLHMIFIFTFEFTLW